MDNQKTTELVEDTDVHKAVRDAYANRVTGKGGCCSTRGKSPYCAAPSSNIERAAEQMGYTKEDLENAPEESNLGLGCGAPLTAAAVREGETVLDLGSGAGFDAFLAANKVGETGHVIGVDMTPEMIEKASANAKKRVSKGGPSIVEFREGKIEALPVKDASVDVIISNCVINLSPDKLAVFREAFRVLKPGGRVAVSDIVLTRPLPERIANNLAAYVGCIAGASLLDDYLGAVQEAGFQNVKASTRCAFDVLTADDPVVMAAFEGVEQENIDLESLKGAIVSATVVAFKAG
jgi:arsenite methyltransferase